MYIIFLAHFLGILTLVIYSCLSPLIRNEEKMATILTNKISAFPYKILQKIWSNYRIFSSNFVIGRKYTISKINN